MTLLITIFAAVIVTAIWYVSKKARKLNIKIMMYMFWGASLMWLVDAIVEYMEIGAEYFQPDTASMLNDTFLGLSVTALALIVWTVSLLVKAPCNIIKNRLKK